MQVLANLVAFLGHIVSSVGKEVDSKKTYAVKNWPRPLSPTDNKAFWAWPVIVEDLWKDSGLLLLH